MQAKAKLMYELDGDQYYHSIVLNDGDPEAMLPWLRRNSTPERSIKLFSSDVWSAPEGEALGEMCVATTFGGGAAGAQHFYLFVLEQGWFYWEGDNEIPQLPAVKQQKKRGRKPGQKNRPKETTNE